MIEAMITIQKFVMYSLFTRDLKKETVKFNHLVMYATCQAAHFTKFLDEY